jgi:hypothetical protein
MPTQLVTQEPERDVTYPILISEHAHIIDDGGMECFETVITDDRVVGLYQSGILNVGNPRPDHDHISLKSGKVRYRNTPARLEQWAEQLCNNEAILGNLTWNIDPTVSEFDYDPTTGHLRLLSGELQTPDSATRTRAIIRAANATPRTMTPGTRFAVRIWLADEEQQKRIFHFYNQMGKPVDKTVAKFNFQASPEQELAKNLMVRSKHLGVTNVETKGNRVSASSNKLCAFNTLSQAFEDFWTAHPESEEDLESQTAFVVRYWKTLVDVLPDLGVISLARRKELRPDPKTGRGGSLVDKALAIHGYIGLADRIWNVYQSTESLDLHSTLEPLADEHFWCYDNPEWIDLTVLVKAQNKNGDEHLQLRNARQTRQAMRDALIRKVGI